MTDEFSLYVAVDVDVQTAAEITDVMELWYIFPEYIICLYDQDLRPTFTKIGSCDLKHILKICAYFEIYRPLRF